MRRRLIRSPRYIPSLLWGLATIVAGSALIGVLGPQLREVQVTLARRLRDGPWFDLLLTASGFLQVAALVAPLAVVSVLLLVRRTREALVIATAGALGAALDLGIAIGLQRASLTDALATIREFNDSTPLPTQFTITSLVAILVVARPWGPRRWITVGWWIIGISVFTRFVAADVPMSPVVLLLGVGVSSGALVGMLAGEIRRTPDTESVRLAAARIGLHLREVREAPAPSSTSAAWIGVESDGRQWLLIASGPDQVTEAIIRQAGRLTFLTGVGDRPPIRDLRRAVEHRALNLLVAAQSGARVPASRGVASVADEILLTLEFIEGSRLSALSADELLDGNGGTSALADAWRQTAALHAAGIRHGDLILDNAVLHPGGQVWWVDLDDAEIDAAPVALASDVANLLASSFAVVGPDHAVDVAVREMGADAVAAALPHLQPAGLRSTARRQRRGLGELRAAASDRVGVQEVELAKVARFRPRTLIGLAMLAGAFYLLLPQLGNADEIRSSLAAADRRWVLLALLASIVSYLGAGLSLVGSVPGPVPFGWATGATVATSFTNAVAPAGVGGMALSVRFLQRLGIATPVAATSVAVKTLGGFLVHLVLMGTAVFVAGRADVFTSVNIPWTTVGWIVAGLLLLVLAVLATPPGRRFAERSLAPRLRQAVSGLGAVVSSPSRLAALFGGSALLTIAYAVCLVCSARAVGIGSPPSELAIVYLTAAIVATVAPTPGGLGPAEAAYAAALGAIGVAAGPAIACVLVFRLMTFWLPIAPGYWTMRLMERRRLL